MTPPRLMHISCARALDPNFKRNPGTEGSWRWLEGVLREAMEPHGLARTRVPVRLVIGGSVEHGDGLVFGLARELKIPLVVVDLDGHWYKVDEATHPSEQDQGSWLGWAEEVPGEAFPLRRDRAMATLAAKAVTSRSRPHALLALGFTAPWSRTRGTLYTLDRMREVAALAPDRATVSVESCPKLHAPGF